MLREDANAWLGGCLLYLLWWCLIYSYPSLPLSSIHAFASFPFQEDFCNHWITWNNYMDYIKVYKLHYEASKIYRLQEKMFQRQKQKNYYGNIFKLYKLIANIQNMDTWKTDDGKRIRGKRRRISTNPNTWDVISCFKRSYNTTYAVRSKQKHSKLYYRTLTIVFYHCSYPYGHNNNNNN